MMKSDSKDLFDNITEAGALTEEHPRKFFYQVISAVVVCHKRGLVYKDSKDDNILVDLKRSLS